jgi:hypothetical protein
VAIVRTAPSVPEEKLAVRVTDTRLSADVGGTFTDITLFDDGHSA